MSIWSRSNFEQTSDTPPEGGPMTVADATGLANGKAGIMASLEKGWGLMEGSVG